MQTTASACALLAVALAGCQPDTSADIQPDPSMASDTAPVTDMHTSRISLDWPGQYEGLLVSSNGPGVHTRLTLEQGGRFEIVTRHLARDAVPVTREGQFEWEPDGNTIVLATEDEPRRFAVGEGRLLLLDAGQAQPAWDRANATLVQASPAWQSGPPGDMLADHRWLLANATDARDQRIEALFPEGSEPFAFRFQGSGLQATGGCNGFRGGFQLNADGSLAVTPGISSMMACAEPLMAADAALLALLAEPLETALVRGNSPTLVLITQAGDALALTGELTPEAQFGAPTRVFLEVDEQLVECEGSVRDDGLCLSVRERNFDEQGLLIATASDWQAFTADIQGYRHETGIRNVLRVNRFDPAPGPDAPHGPIYVLDMVVQSEVVPR